MIEGAKKVCNWLIFNGGIYMPQFNGGGVMEVRAVDRDESGEGWRGGEER